MHEAWADDWAFDLGTRFLLRKANIHHVLIHFEDGETFRSGLVRKNGQKIYKYWLQNIQNWCLDTNKQNKKITGRIYIRIT